MTHGLAIIAPPEADYFSFAARSAVNEINIFLCDLCGSSTAQSGTGGECLFKSLHDSQIHRGYNPFCAPLSTIQNRNPPHLIGGQAPKSKQSFFFEQLDIFDLPGTAIHHKRHQGVVLVPPIMGVAEMADRAANGPGGIGDKSIIR
jgi:hypothetical protein